jgi:D-3-phosphoglycerate dehydrogenase
MSGVRLPPDAREVLLTDAQVNPFVAEERAAIERAGLRLVELAGHNPEEIAEKGSDAVAIFVYHARLGQHDLSRLPRLRVIARCGAGIDGIDVRAARARGIEVTYIPDYGADEVAEHAIALMLAVARGIGFADRAVRGGDWPTCREIGITRRLAGRTLGLIGCGRIGSRVAAKAQGLGMTTIAYDPYASEAPPGVRLMDREQVFAESDVVSLHLPLTPETERSVGADDLARMREGAILVNTSRGSVVDTPVVVERLKSGRLAGAGLDVFDTEPLPSGHPLRELDHVVLTPHMAPCGEESLAEIRQRALENVLAVLSDQAAPDPVPDSALAR